MKYLLPIFFITSCALPPRYNGNKPALYQEKLKKCTIELVGKYGVEAEKAVKVCKNIYKAR
jgi:hypothetical protein